MHDGRDATEGKSPPLTCCTPLERKLEKTNKSRQNGQDRTRQDDTRPFLINFVTITPQPLYSR